MIYTRENFTKLELLEKHRDFLLEYKGRYNIRQIKETHEISTRKWFRTEKRLETRFWVTVGLNPWLQDLVHRYGPFDSEDTVFEWWAYIELTL